jgi:hypothetical protein
MSNRIGNSCHCAEAYSPNQSQAGATADARAARRAERQAARQATSPTSSFSGAQAGYQSQESAALEVKTADGDTVRISFAALTKAQAGVYSAKAGNAQAGAQSFSGESSFAVQVDVQGSLDDNEVNQISDLLQKLVGASRSQGGAAAPAAGATPAPPATGASDYSSLSSFRYAYQAYQESSNQTLQAKAA